MDQMVKYYFTKKENKPVYMGSTAMLYPRNKKNQGLSRLYKYCQNQSPYKNTFCLLIKLQATGQLDS